MEYLSFGRSLERCRFHFLPQLAGTQRALLLGDGDGRFAERLLRVMLALNPSHTGVPLRESPPFVAVDASSCAPTSDLRGAGSSRILAIDGSSAMLSLLRSRCSFADHMLQTCLADLAKGLPETIGHQQFDLVTTHFFLDCLSTDEVERLVSDVRPCMTEGGTWVVSEFAVPARGAMQLPAWMVVRGLYLGFRLLTGLRTRRLPDYPTAMRRHGLALEQQASMLGGLLTAQLWRCGADGNR